MIRVGIFTKPEQVTRLISMLMSLILLVFIRLDSPLSKRVTRYRLRLTLFIFNSPSLIPSNIGYKSTLSIILNKPSLSLIKDRSQVSRSKLNPAAINFIIDLLNTIILKSYILVLLPLIKYTRYCLDILVYLTKILNSLAGCIFDFRFFLKICTTILDPQIRKQSIESTLLYQA